MTATRRFQHYSRQKLLRMARLTRWVHTIDLGDGHHTEGEWGTGNPHVLAAFDKIDFHGKKVLDIGCWDGLYSFEAEARGASQAYATDLVTQRRYGTAPSFEIAAALRNSKAHYLPDTSVYQLEKLDTRDFDIVLFMGVYYHLKDPLLAFSTLRRVMRRGGVLVVEGAVLGEAGCFARFFYDDLFQSDASNWWVPTVDCLKQWVTASLFDVQQEFPPWSHAGTRRHTLLAQATERADARYVRPDELLSPYLISG